MSSQKRSLEAVPEDTAKIARASFRKGALAIQLRDALEGVYDGSDYDDLYPHQGGAFTPWRLALVLVLQTIEGLSDEQAAEMVRNRIDWKYALSLSLDDTGFDASALAEFRTWLVEKQAQSFLLDPILHICVERGWIKERGKQHVDSTLVLSQMRRLTGLERVVEALQAALNALAEEEPEWLLTVVTPDWFDRYGDRSELQRFPKGKEARQRMIAVVGEDCWKLLEATRSKEAPQGVGDLEEVGSLGKVWDQYYEVYEGKVKWRDDAGGLSKTRGRK